MPTLTDYLVLRDGSVELDSEFDHTAESVFSLDSDFTAGTRLAKPILAFIVKPLSANAKMSVVVGSDPGGSEGFLQKSRTVSQLIFDGGASHDHGLWESFSGELLTPGARNVVSFIATEGRLRVRDVVLWHQREAGA